MKGRHVLKGLDWRHAAIPAAIVLAATLGAGVIAGPQATAASLIPALAVAGLVLACAAPAGLLAIARHDWRGRSVLAIVAGLFVLNMVSLMLPRVGVFSVLDWNWQGKTLDLVWCLALIALLGPETRREIGWTWQTHPKTLPVAFINIVILAVVGFVVLGAGAPGDADRGGLTLERVLFDTAHPNLVEEIVFRGFMLALLDRAFPPKWTFAGAKVGWGVVLTAWLFGLVHGIALDAGGGMVFDPVYLVMTFVAGLLLGWMRALTGSLWPAYLAHCAPEIGILFALASS